MCETLFYGVFGLLSIFIQVCVSDIHFEVRLADKDYP